MGDLLYAVVVDGDAAKLLPPVLEKIEGVVNVIHTGCVRINPENTTIIPHLTHFSSLRTMRSPISL
jgi:hypothetical protein